MKKNRLRRLYWRIRIIWMSARWIFRVNIGDYVWYKGNKHIILNGVRPYSWRLNGVKNGDEGWVKRKDCKKVWSFSNCLHGFQYEYSFYMGYRLDAWVENGVEDCMRTCNIWPGRWREPS